MTNAMRRFGLATTLAFLVTAGQARAGLVIFDLTYSGVPDGNSATGTGTITFDPSTLTNPGFSAFSPTAFSITIANDGAGNGTFGLADFTIFFLDTGSLPLDFTKELVGQPTGIDPFGTPGGEGGDFNFFSSGADANAPSGVDNFTIATSVGDGLQLTSFVPEPAVNPVPEPATLSGASLAALMGMGYAWRRKAKAAA